MKGVDNSHHTSMKVLTVKWCDVPRRFRYGMVMTLPSLRLKKRLYEMEWTNNELWLDMPRGGRKAEGCIGQSDHDLRHRKLAARVSRGGKVVVSCHLTRLHYAPGQIRWTWIWETGGTRPRTSSQCFEGLCDVDRVPNRLSASCRRWCKLPRKVCRIPAMWWSGCFAIVEDPAGFLV